MDQFVDHFKNLISNDNVENGPDTTDTMECVFEELDKLLTETHKNVLSLKFSSN
jgi:hypothetical protein